MRSQPRAIAASPARTTSSSSSSTRPATRDPAGNEAAAPLSYSVVYDPLPPALELDVSPLTNDCEGDVTVRLRDAESNALLSATVTASPDPAARVIAYSGSPGADLTIPVAVAPSGIDSASEPSPDLSGTDYSDGEYVLNARALDRAGNVAQVSRTVVVDRTPPVVMSATCPGCLLRDDGKLTARAPLSA